VNAAQVDIGSFSDIRLSFKSHLKYLHPSKQHEASIITPGSSVFVYFVGEFMIKLLQIVSLCPDFI